MKELSITQVNLRNHFEASLYDFARYINPTYMYGTIHEKVFEWLQNNDENQLLLLPRGHLKSHCIAVWVVWMITKNPWTSVVYVSASDDLAKVQVYAIKNMLDSPEYSKLWPEMIHEEKHERDKWSQWAINVDHPTRQERRIRDFTLVVRTIKGTATGLHCDILVYDDVVTDRNAYTTGGREEVRSGVSSFTGVKNPGAITKAVGTRYHPQDIYNDWMEAELNVVGGDGAFTGETEPQWVVAEAVVEDAGDGTGEYLWPRVKCPKTGMWYGFDIRVWATKQADYLSHGKGAQFWAQYYNEPNDPTAQRVGDDSFRYYERGLLTQSRGKWYYDGKALSVFAGMDLAFSDDTGKTDYSAIAVVGVDWEGFVYILEVMMYRTMDASLHYSNLMSLHDKWSIRKIKIETNNGGKLIDRQIKNMLRENGRSLNIVSVAKTKHDGNKLERYAMTLEPRYRQGVILHYKGGLIPTYEDQVKKVRPKNDDLKDAVTDAIEIMEIPTRSASGPLSTGKVQQASSRFGGRIRRRA